MNKKEMKAKAKDLKPIENELLQINAEIEDIIGKLGLPREVVAQLLLQREIVILNKQINDLLEAIRNAQKTQLQS